MKSDLPVPGSTRHSRMKVRTPRGQVQPLKAPYLPGGSPCRVVRLSARRHLHCTDTPQGNCARSCAHDGQLLKVRCARGSRATGVCALTHAPAHRNACGRRTRSWRSCLAPSSRLPCPDPPSPVVPGDRSLDSASGSPMINGFYSQNGRGPNPKCSRY
jgi:hypothetical protein